MVVSRSPSGMPPHAARTLFRIEPCLCCMQTRVQARRSPLPPPPPLPASQVRHYSAPAEQLLLLRIKLEEMENVESVSLPADVTYTMTASGGDHQRERLPLACCMGTACCGLSIGRS